MDFSFIRGNLAEQPPEQPTEQLLGSKPIEVSLELKSRLQGLTEAREGQEQAPQLKRLYTTEQADHIRSLNMYKDYQNNIKAAGQLRTEILKGTRAAEDSLSLLLKACKCISCMTGDKLFYEQIEADVVSIYGLGLGEPEPIRKELEEVRIRLGKLQEAAERETHTDSKARIAAAIKSHKQREAYLQGLLEE